MPVSLTLLLQKEVFVSPVLFSFFDGLIPEGWPLDNLAPAYNLLNVAIANLKDKEELEPTLWDKKSNLRMNDFLNASKKMMLEENVVRRLITRLRKALPKWKQLIQEFFLSEENKRAYEELIVSRLDRLKTE